MRYNVIHHSVTGLNVRDSVLKSWKFYNRIIKPDGSVIKQHDTWHYRGQGNESWDICLVGNFEIGCPTGSQLKSLSRILKDCPVIGHRDIRDKGFTVGILDTLCPGKNLYKLLGNLGNIQNIKMKYIQINNHSDKAINHLLSAVKQWYADRGESITFEGINPWAVADIYVRQYASGGCKDAKPYKIMWMLGDLDNGKHGKSLHDILIHEIMHCYFYEAGLGDIHDIKTKEYPRGLTGSHANEYNWNYYLSKTTMKVNKSQLQKLYRLIFKREMGVEAEPYIGHDLDFILDEFVKSKEHKAYKKLYEAGKEIERL